MNVYRNDRSYRLLKLFFFEYEKLGTFHTQCSKNLIGKCAMNIIIIESRLNHYFTCSKMKEYLKLLDTYVTCCQAQRHCTLGWGSVALQKFIVRKVNYQPSPGSHCYRLPQLGHSHCLKITLCKLYTWNSWVHLRCYNQPCSHTGKSGNAGL